MDLLETYRPEWRTQQSDFMSTTILPAEVRHPFLLEFGENSKLMVHIGEFSKLNSETNIFRCKLTKKLLHAYLCQTRTDFGVSLELTPNSKKYACTQFFLKKNMRAQGF